MSEIPPNIMSLSAEKIQQISANCIRIRSWQSTWQQGANAFHNGMARSDNPYNPYDPRPEPGTYPFSQHIGWRNGFDWARLQSKLKV